jgi:uncharacterized protein YdaU (DUF1376 family)
MDLAQEGAYRRLMDTCWLENGLPADPAILWRLAKAESRDHFERHLWPAMSHKFLERGGKLYHPRLDDERRKQRKNRKARQLAANARWNNTTANALHLSMQMQSPPSSSAIATAVRTKEPPNPPRRGGRPITKREFEKAAKHRTTVYGRCPHNIDHPYRDCVDAIALTLRGGVSGPDPHPPQAREETP